LKVKMLTSMASADFSYSPGEVVEVSEDVARAWQTAMLAEIVKENEKPAKKEKKAVKDSEADNTANPGANNG